MGASGAGVLTGARRGGKEMGKAGANVAATYRLTRRNGRGKETAKGDAGKTRNGPFAKQRQVAVSALGPTVG